MKKLFFICLTFGMIHALSSQSAYNDVLKLKNGHKLNGKIIHYTQDSVALETKDGVHIMLPTSTLRKLEMDGTALQTYSYTTNKPYVRLQGSMLYSSSNRGMSASISGGYIFNRLMSVGGGTGIDNYYKENGFNFIPIFVEWYGYLLKSNTTPYLSVRGGYNFAIESTETGFLNPTDNFFINPTFGIRLGSGAIQTNIFVGAKFQKFQVQTVGENTLNQYSITFRRYDMGIAFVF
ncbi:MAG: hypothetical protein R2774_08570 [Saprospiraceae bacterium]